LFPEIALLFQKMRALLYKPLQELPLPRTSVSSVEPGEGGASLRAAQAAVSQSTRADKAGTPSATPYRAVKPIPAELKTKPTSVSWDQYAAQVRIRRVDFFP